MTKRTQDMTFGGEAAWLLTVYEKAALGIRAYSLPKAKDGALKIKVPSLMEQAVAMRKTK